ncbi:MAG: type II toxin-antitoxin system Phd/YefM family antitoxin [Chloroflexi bacterium]|nr:type II toxin-antitoxin system Phd/YefM family antitoxin [Chloroflexota bacterium]
MTGQLIRVGVQEFREDLAEYLDSPVPVAITRDGQTVGYYVPARGHVDDQEVRALKRAAMQLEALLSEHDVSEEEVVREFRARRARG